MAAGYVREGFKRIGLDTLGELKSLARTKEKEGKLIQVFYPERNEYIMGRLGRVKQKTRTFDGQEEKDIILFIKNGVRRPALPYDNETYENIVGGHPRPEIYVGRTLKREVEFKPMEETSEEPQ